MGKTLLFLMLLVATVTAVGQSSQEWRNQLLGAKGEEKVRLLLELTYYYASSNADSSIYFGLQGLALAEELERVDLVASAKNDLSIPYYYMGDHQEAIALNNDALEYRVGQGDSLGVLASLAKLGNSYSEWGKLKEALACNLRAIRIAEDSSNLVFIYQITNNLGNIYERNGDLKSSRQAYNKVVEMCVKFNDTVAIMIAKGNLANSYQLSSEHLKAEVVYHEVIDLAKLSGKKEYLAQAYQGLGTNLRLQEKHFEAIKVYDDALELYDTLKILDSYSAVAVNIGNAYCDLQYYEEAEAYLLKGLDGAKAHNSYLRLQHAYKGLMIVYEKMGDMSNAYTYGRLAAQYKDSIYDESSAQSMVEMRTLYQTEKKEKELIEADLLSADQQVAIKNGNIRTLIIRGLAIVLVLIALFIYRNQRHKRQLEADRFKLKSEIEKAEAARKMTDEKLRISRELHDNIGAQLTFMISSVDNISYGMEKDKSVQLQQISEFGRESMNDLRNTIWAMNKDQGNFETLFNKLADLKLLLKDTVTIELINDSKQKTLNSLEILNLYRIIQEFVQNTVKYGSASVVKVVAKENDEKVNLVLEDDGVGFDEKEVKAGNGIRNMKKRADDINALLEISASNGNGVQVRIEI